MSQREGQTVTKEDIVDYVDRMEIKKVNLGGFDKVDVYVHIQELVKMYGAYTEQELGKQSETIKNQQEEIEKLGFSERAAREELAARKEYVQTCEAELKSQREENQGLAAYREEAQRLRSELDEKDCELEKQRQEMEELGGYKNSVSELQKETERLKADNVRLSSGKGILYRQDQTVESLKKELEEQKREAGRLREELEERRRESESRKNELQQQIQETESLKARLEPEPGATGREAAEAQEQALLALIEELQTELREKEQALAEREARIQALLQEAENQERENQSVNDYEEEIEEILSEARREGQSILDNAQIEAEQEMVRLLKLRVRFKQERELYQEWCGRVESEKEAVEVFLKQLTDQYSNVSQVLREVKEKADSFDIKRIYQVEGIGKESAGETEYEEADS